MKKFIQILDILFAFEDKKREEIYSKSLDDINGSSLEKKIKDFHFYINKNKYNFIQYSQDKNEIYLKLDEILSKQKQNLFYIIAHFQINFSKIISEPDILKFIFFKIYRWKYMNNFQKKIDLKNNYANFNNEICLNLVLSFFEELDEKRK